MKTMGICSYKIKGKDKLFQRFQYYGKNKIGLHYVHKLDGKDNTIQTFSVLRGRKITIL
jgi:hypothetical protein